MTLPARELKEEIFTNPFYAQISITKTDNLLLASIDCYKQYCTKDVTKNIDTMKL